MARFRFPLQAVLDQREAAEKERQRAVAELERERVAIEGEISGCQELIAGSHADVRALLGGGVVSLLDVRRDVSAAVRADATARRAALRLAGVHRRLTAARGALLQAARARRAVELLKERRYEQWRADERRREAAETDELAVMRAGRDGIEP
jgi:flagellar FliJ protein